MANTLVDICDPLFQYITRLNRLARKGGLVDAGQVRSEIRSLLAEIKLKCDGTPGMAEQFAKVRLPLIYFADFMVRDSALPFASSWKSLAEEEGKLGGDQLFWQHLDETLAESSEAATQRLAVYYTCIGLGFTGFNIGQPDVLRRKMLEISARIKPMMDADENSRVTPEAYESVDTRQLQQPVAGSIMGWVIALVSMSVALVVGNFVLYGHAKDSIEQSLNQITEAPATGGESPGE